MSLFGNILTAAVDTVALPVKIGEAGLGFMIGSDGKELKRALPVPSDITDKLKEIIEEADEE